MKGMKPALSLNSTVVASKDQTSADLGGESVLLHLQSGVYYGLDTIGARIWDWVKQPQRVSEVRDRMLEQYDVEPDRCEKDLLDLLSRLSKEGLIDVQNETTP